MLVSSQQNHLTHVKCVFFETDLNDTLARQDLFPPSTTISVFLFYPILSPISDYIFFSVFSSPCSVTMVVIWHVTRHTECGRSSANVSSFLGGCYIIYMYVCVYILLTNYALIGINVHQ